MSFNTSEQVSCRWSHMGVMKEVSLPLSWGSVTTEPSGCSAKLRFCSLAVGGQVRWQLAKSKLGSHCGQIPVWLCCAWDSHISRALAGQLFASCSF